MLNGLPHRSYSLSEVVQNLEALRQEGELAVDLEGRLLYRSGLRFHLLSILSGGDPERIEAIRIQTLKDLDTLQFPKGEYLYYYPRLKRLGVADSDFKRRIRGELAEEEIASKTGRWPIAIKEADWAAHINELFSSFFRKPFTALTLYYALQHRLGSEASAKEAIWRLHRVGLQLLCKADLKIYSQGIMIEEDCFQFGEQGITRYSSAPLRTLIEESEFDPRLRATQIGYFYPTKRILSRGITDYPQAKRLVDVKGDPVVVKAVIEFLEEMFDENYTLSQLNPSHFAFYEGRLVSFFPEKWDCFNYRILYDFIRALWGDSAPLFKRGIDAIGLLESNDFAYFLAIVGNEGTSRFTSLHLRDPSLLDLEGELKFVMSHSRYNRPSLKRYAVQNWLFFRLPPEWFSKGDSASGARQIFSPPSRLLLGGATSERRLLLAPSSSSPSR